MATALGSGSGVGNFAVSADGSRSDGANAPSSSADRLANLLSSLRHSDLPSVSFSFQAWVEIAGVEYAAVQVAVTQSRIESRAICELAVGSNTRDLAGRKSMPANFRFIRGTPARVMLLVEQDVASGHAGSGPLLRAGTHVLFNGVVDDGGPSNLSHGRFNLRVVIVSRLLYLATGSVQFDGLPSGYVGGGLANLLNTEFPIVMDEETARRDFWEAIRATYTELIKIEESNVGDLSNGSTSFDALTAFLQEFGTQRSTANATLLAEIKGALPGGIFSDTAMSYCVTRYFNAELGYDLAQQSILQRIRALGEDFHFALVEHGTGYAVVPYTPFVPRSAITQVIWPDTVYGVQWSSQSTATIAGLAFIDNPYGSVLHEGRPDGEQASTYAVFGAYKRPGTPNPLNPVDPQGDALGLILPLPAPTWISGRLGRREADSVVTLGLTANPTEELRRFGSPYARELALKKCYMGKALTVECPLRMDIGVCSPVKVVYPDVAGTGLQDAAAIYGAVESVSILLDASSKRAVTVLEVMYARSEQQQIQDIDPGPIGPDSPGSPAYLHPIWAEAYLGRRLDEHPDANDGAEPAAPAAAG